MRRSTRSHLFALLFFLVISSSGALTLIEIVIGAIAPSSVLGGYTIDGESPPPIVLFQDPMEPDDSAIFSINTNLTSVAPGNRVRSWISIEEPLQPENLTFVPVGILASPISPSQCVDALETEPASSRCNFAQIKFANGTTSAFASVLRISGEMTVGPATYGPPGSTSLFYRLLYTVVNTESDPVELQLSVFWLTWLADSPSVIVGEITTQVDQCSQGEEDCNIYERTLPSGDCAVVGNVCGAVAPETCEFDGTTCQITSCSKPDDDPCGIYQRNEDDVCVRTGTSLVDVNDPINGLVTCPPACSSPASHWLTPGATGCPDTMSDFWCNISDEDAFTFYETLVDDTYRPSQSDVVILINGQLVVPTRELELYLVLRIELIVARSNVACNLLTLTPAQQQVLDNAIQLVDETCPNFTIEGISDCETNGNNNNKRCRQQQVGAYRSASVELADIRRETACAATARFLGGPSDESIASLLDRVVAGQLPGAGAESGLSSGAIVGIVIGALAGVVLIAVIVMVLFRPTTSAGTRSTRGRY